MNDEPVIVTTEMSDAMTGGACSAFVGLALLVIVLSMGGVMIKHLLKPILDETGGTSGYGASRQSRQHQPVQSAHEPERTPSWWSEAWDGLSPRTRQRAIFALIILSALLLVILIIVSQYVEVNFV